MTPLPNRRTLPFNRIADAVAALKAIKADSRGHRFITSALYDIANHQTIGLGSNIELSYGRYGSGNPRRVPEVISSGPFRVSLGIRGGEYSVSRLSKKDAHIQMDCVSTDELTVLKAAFDTVKDMSPAFNHGEIDQIAENILEADGLHGFGRRYLGQVNM